MKRRYISIIAGTLISFTSLGQLTVTNTQTPEEIVQNVLLGAGVTASNVTWNGNAANATTVQAALGEFGGTSNIGIPEGVILSCGNVSEAEGPNDEAGASNNTGITDYQSDTDLQSLQPGGVNIHDGGVLEFDFVPTGDSISFQYVFASEEYPEFAPPNNSGFNDAFGFFLTGPNPAGGAYASQNIALLPDGVTIVSINNINPQDNTTYYVDNAGGTSVEYDGFTTALRAQAAVECGETYHIKLAISDAGDQQFNSAVFLEANSFASNGVQVAVVTQTGDTTIVEGCASADIIFTRPIADTADLLVIECEIGGTAINGTDFDMLGSTVTFEPGDQMVTVSFNPISDGIDEDPEEVTITVYTLNPCGDTIVSTGTLWILDPYAEVAVNDTILPCPMGDSVLLTATPVAGVQPYNFTWFDGSTGNTIMVPADASGTFSYEVTMTDLCNESGTGSGTVTVGIYDAASFTATPTSGQAPLTVNYNNTSNPSAASFDWVFGNGLTESTTTPSNVSTTFVDAGEYTTILTVTSPEGCVDTAQASISVFNLPEVSAPNVFTPNNDDNNDVFQFFNYSNVDQFECFITNRWGNVMLEMDDITDTWDGTTKNGAEAEEGTYFYQYIGRSASGHEVTGHGFFQLVRD